VARERSFYVPVKQIGHEPMIAFQPAQDGARLVGGKDYRDFRRTGDALDLVHEIELSFEHLRVKKEQGAEGLILSGGSDVALDGKVCKKCADFVFGHIAGVAFSVKKNETANPIDVRLFGADAVMLDAQMSADAVE
jgi:hypothetical protein